MARFLLLVFLMYKGREFFTVPRRCIYVMGIEKVLVGLCRCTCCSKSLLFLHDKSICDTLQLKGASQISAPNV